MELEREEIGYTPRDPNTIDLKNFDPIWFPGHKFPGHIPKDLLEVVGTGHGIQAAGSLRSLFWVLGMDEAVDIIDDPTTKLNDCLEVVPFGVDMDGFLTNRYIERDLLPSSLEDKRLGNDPSSPPTHKFPVYTPKIPCMVTETPATVDLATLDYLPGSGFPPSVKVLKIPNEKDDSAWASKAQDSYPDFLQQRGLSFRGVSLNGLEQALGLNLPTINEAIYHNEFGSALYTTPCLMCAKRFAGRGGAIMVFCHEDTEDLEVWNLSLDEWKVVVGRHHPGLPYQHHEEVFAKFRKADIITGPVLRRPGMEANSDVLEQTDDVQHAYRTYRSCGRLASSLVGIIYVG